MSTKMSAEKSAVKSTEQVDPTTLAYDDRGLVAVVVQEVSTGTVLMLAWADREAVTRTLDTGEGWFWSRSRQELWRKGATSGNTLEVVEVLADCDADALLYRVNATGPTCHTGSLSCFADRSEQLQLGWLWRVLESRRGDDPDSSYTASLLERGRPRIAQKVAEEAAETVIAGLTMTNSGEPADSVELVNEAADLMYHLCVLLLDAGVEPRRVAERLAARHRQKPIEDRS